MANVGGPSKSDINAVFKRLRSASMNKQCFDCGALNPTWASVTYGVFLCLDCSAVHRSLGVHVTFIRSTQLDTNWQWLQLRAMQVGGNLNGTTFFRQHGCTSNDAQQKYHSRAAQMYREKLHSLSLKAVKQHGTQLFLREGDHLGKKQIHLDSVSSPPAESKEVDFFAEHVNGNGNSTTAPAGFSQPPPGSTMTEPVNIANSSLANRETKQVEVEDDGRAPNVEPALSMSPTQALQHAEPRKATIGARKPAGAKKSGLGAKKGLGAQKVKSNFAEIETQAAQRDKDREEMSANMLKQQVQSKEDEQKHVASLKLAYKDLSLEEKKRDDQFKHMDPKKAAQMERLGMGFKGNRSVSHSVMSTMQVIEQENPNSGSVRTTNSYDRARPGRDDSDDFDMLGSGFSSGPPKYDDSPFGLKKEDRYSSWSNNGSSGSSSSSKNNRNSSWDDLERFEKQSSTRDELTPVQSAEEDRGRSRKNYEAATGTDAQKKFGSAKAISSDMYHGNHEPDFEMRQKLSKYEGSTSLSSAQLFGREDSSRGSGGGSYSSGPDLSEIRDGVKTGVTKVAGRLSNLANGVINSIQDHYG